MFRNYVLFLFFLLIYFTSNDKRVTQISAQEIPSQFLTFCPEPLVFRNSTDRDKDIRDGFNYVSEYCILRCPSPIFSEDQWKSYKLLSIVMGSVSFISSVLVMITYSIIHLIYMYTIKSNEISNNNNNNNNSNNNLKNKNSSNRIKSNNHPNTIPILFLSIGVIFLMLPDLALAYYGFSDGYLCNDNGLRSSRQHLDSGCAVSGLSFQFGGLLTMTSFTVSSIDLWISIKRFKIQKKIVQYYILVLLGIPTILSIGPLALKQQSYWQGGLGCFILEQKYQTIFFWAPLSVMCFISAISIGMILYEVYKIMTFFNRNQPNNKNNNNNKKNKNNVNKVKNQLPRNINIQASDDLMSNSGSVVIPQQTVSISGKKKKKRFIKYYLRPFILIVIICSEFLYLVIYNYYITDNIPIYSKKLEHYLTCITMSAILNVPSDECKFTSLPFAPHIMSLFFTRLLGVELLIFYGFGRYSLKIWSAVVLKIFNSKPQVMSPKSNSNNKKSKRNSFSTTTTSSSSIDTASNTIDQLNNDIELDNINLNV